MNAGNKKNILGALARRERRLAFGLLLPTFLLVLAIVLFPLFANFWISFKPISLADLRPPTIFVKERIKGKFNDLQEPIKIEYRFRNSSIKYALSDVVFKDDLPQGVEVVEIGKECFVSKLSGVETVVCEGNCSPERKRENRIKSAFRQ